METTSEAVINTPQDSYRYDRHIPEVPMSNKARAIMIQQLDYGYKVQVGCQSFAIESREKVIAKLTEYLVNPEQIEADYRDKKFTLD